jgi:nitrite reductase (NO-forming)
MDAACAALGGDKYMVLPTLNPLQCNDHGDQIAGHSMPHASKRSVGRALAAAVVVILALTGTVCPAAAADQKFTLTVESKPIRIGSGLTYKATTFNGSVPGPVLKVREGDDVTITLVNHTGDAHGINVHAAQIAPSHFAGDPIKPVSYTFRAAVPGVFAYTCYAPPILDHIASGMYGMMIVEPKDGWPGGDAQEVTLVQSEFYGLPDKRGFINGDHSKMIAAHPDFIVFDGAMNKHDRNRPIKLKAGKLVRVFFVNAGPNMTSSFHVAGVLFSTVYRGGNPANAMHGVNTFEVAPSDGAVFEFTANEPGIYSFTDLNRASQYKGAAGIFKVEP